MNIDANDWQVDYDRLKREFQGHRRISSQLTRDVVQDLVQRLAQLERELNVMRGSPMQYDIWSSEIVRRQVILESLRKQVTSSTDTPSVGVMSATPGATVGGPGASGNGGMGGSVVVNPLNTSDRGLVQRQREVLEMQDTMILDIEKGVDRLHQTAKEIGKETKEHGLILDELDAHVDDATERLKIETAHTEQVRRKGEVCYMYICICVEVVILLLLVLVMFLHK